MTDQTSDGWARSLGEINEKLRQLGHKENQ